MTPTTGIEAVFLTTRNWGRSAKFFQSLGFKLEFETDHASGQLRAENGPYLFIAEVPDEEPATQLTLHVDDADAFELDLSIEVVSPFEDTHWGTRQMVVRDPDGRLWNLEAPGSGSPEASHE